MEPGVQTPEETLELGSRLVPRHRVAAGADPAAPRPRGALRVRLPHPAEAGHRGARRPGRHDAHDFTDLHAWAEVYLPGAGWVGLDPTSGLLSGEGHLPLAATPHYRSAAPISGGVEAGRRRFRLRDERHAHRRRAARHLAVLRRSLGRARCAGREGRRDLDRAGRAAHHGRRADLRVRSTTIRRRNGTPRRSARPSDRSPIELVRRLRDRFAPGGLLHYGQGKWYPGEPLPRWAFALFWRTDGKPIWQNEALIATEKAVKNASTPTTPSGSPKASPARLGIAAELCACRPSRTRRSACSRRASCRPTSIRLDPKIDDPHERARIMRDFERGLSMPAGYVLPVQRWSAQARARLDQRSLAVAARPAVPAAGRLAGRLAAAARLAALRSAGGLAASGAGRSARRRATRCPTPERAGTRPMPTDARQRARRSPVPSGYEQRAEGAAGDKRACRSAPR